MDWLFGHRLAIQIPGFKNWIHWWYISQSSQKQIYTLPLYYKPSQRFIFENKSTSIRSMWKCRKYCKVCEICHKIRRTTQGKQIPNIWTQIKYRMSFSKKLNIDTFFICVSNIIWAILLYYSRFIWDRAGNNGVESGNYSQGSPVQSGHNNYTLGLM